MQQFHRSDTVYEDDIIKLHRFHGARNKKSVFICPPHAGRHGNIVQNMADTFSDIGLDTWAYELKSANISTASTSIGDLLYKIHTCLNIIGEPVDIHGVCQGGWLSAMYVASSLHGDQAERLALYAAPLNTKTGEVNAIENYCQNINLPFHQAIVDAHWGIQPGYMQWLAFALANPVPVFVERYHELFQLCLRQELDKIKKWVRNNSWYDTPQNLAGTWYMEALTHHFTNNDLFEGRWQVNGGLISLTNIRCETFTYSGGIDQITHPEQTKGLNGHYHCFPEDGHTAVFTRKKSLAKVISDMY